MTDPLRRFDAFGDTAEGFFVADHRHHIVRWNRGAERMLGHAAGDVLHCPCHEVLAGCDRNGKPICRDDCPVNQCVGRGVLPHSIEMNVPAMDGRRLWIHLSVIVYSTEGGPLTAHVIHDVTGQRHASDVLARVTALCEPEAPPADARRTFTQREREILRLLALGLSNDAIAARLTVSAYTIRNHVQHILTKSGAHSRAEAVSLAFRSGLL